MFGGLLEYFVASAVLSQPQPDKQMPESKQLPRYQSRKQVSAFKIYDVARVTPNVVARLNDEIEISGEGCTVRVDNAWLEKHSPSPSEFPLSSMLGGYLVRYEDGYQSFSPSEAFEEGYTRIDDRSTPRRPNPADGAPKPAGHNPVA
jgi:hypothetical protein